MTSNPMSGHKHLGKPKLFLSNLPREPPKFLQGSLGLDKLVEEFVKKNKLRKPVVSYADRGHIAVLDWKTDRLVMYGPREREYESLGCLGNGPSPGVDEQVYRAEGKLEGENVNLEAHVVTRSYPRKEIVIGGSNMEVWYVDLDRKDKSKYWFVVPART